MFRTIVCGTGSFPEEGDETSSTARKSSKVGSKAKSNSSKKNKNPYTSRGLDKFSNVVADLGERRKQIYDEVGSQEISLVRFGYSYSKGWKPIVVKVRDTTTNDPNRDVLLEGGDHHGESQDESTVSETANQDETKRLINLDQKKKGLFMSLNIEWREPRYYFPMLVVLILLSLAMYGKSFAILCTSMWWYLGPIVNCKDKQLKRLKKKKTLVRKFMSEKKMENDVIGPSLPKTKSLGHGASPGHVNKKSWS